MTNWQDINVQLADALILIKLVHVVAGVYLWEFVLNLHYDYAIIMGKRKFVRTQLLYMGCRWSTLSAIIVQLVGLDTSQPINCRIWLMMNYFFGYLAVLFASSLIILRICALWEKKIIVVVIACSCWLASAASYTYSVATFGGHRVGTFCEVDHSLHNRISVFCTFISDLVLLVFMFIGVLRWKGARDGGGLWWLLYTQGLAWVVTFTLAEVPPVVFIILNLNYAMNRMFLIPAMTIMSIGASRIYIGLVNSVPVINYSAGPVAVKEWARPASTQIRFPNPSEPSSFTEGAYDIAGKGGTLQMA
ncbi:hypothetical protein BJV74DRAFT_166064 [Russula compacta]|nr:hypothetical protein BJV74DRAFT_166064 [Russula compacta]